jgi:hypothetical protein
MNLYKSALGQDSEMSKPAGKLETLESVISEVACPIRQAGKLRIA